MPNRSLILILTFLFSFSSLVYELILAQALSAFLENTVLRYSVTMGLYMFSLGFGSLMAEGRRLKYPVQRLAIIEIILVLIGGCSILALYSFDFLRFPRPVFAALAHLIIIFIGFLSGFEIPFLFELADDQGRKGESLVLGMNYLGAFLGTVVFALFFYPYAGLVSSAFYAALLSAAGGVLLCVFGVNGFVCRSRRRFFIASGVFLCVLISVSLVFSAEISGHLSALYLGK